MQALAQLPKPLQQYLQQTLVQIGDLGGDTHGLWAAAERGLQMEAAGQILAGRALIELREHLPQGAFSSGLADRNIARRSAYNAIEAFEVFAELPNLDSVRALAQLGITKARALKHWSPDEHKAFASGKPVRGIQLDAAVELSSRDLVEQQRDWQLQNESQLRKLQSSNATLETKVETLQNEITRLQRAGSYVVAEEDLPDFARTVRQEALANTEQMAWCLDALQAAAEEHLFAKGKSHPSEFKFKPIAAGTLYYSLAAIHARAQLLLKRIQDQFGDSATGMLTIDMQLSPAEIVRFQEQREQLLATHQAKAKARDNQRENTRPGKRGAKRK
ncbi:MAG TPA: hypothetical protein VHE37_09175 [Nevskiaceae bacterium]|nr:hypothetical protein [Nevskiaceae bacterium]